MGPKESHLGPVAHLLRKENMTAESTNTCPFSGHSLRESEWSPSMEETFDSAHEDYAELRENNPFPWSNDFGGFWSATTYDDILAVTQNDDLFSTAKQNVVPHVPRSSRRPPLHFDPPEHTEYREALDPVFRRSIVTKHRDSYRNNADKLIDSLLKAESPDAVRDYAAPFVLECFATFLGVSRELTQEIREIGVRYSFAIQDMDNDVIAESSTRLYEIATEMYGQASNTESDAATNLLASLHQAANDPNNGITEKTAIATVRQLIVAGMGAPQAALGSCIVHLAKDQQLQQHLRDETKDLPAAIEELLRLYSPYRVFARTATKETTFHGRTVLKDEPIALIYPSANRDPSKFEEPDRFILRRKNNSHLAFGRGSHRCPAAALGRIELFIALERLLSRTSSFTLNGGIEMMNWLEYGPRAVPLKLTPREG